MISLIFLRLGYVFRLHYRNKVLAHSIILLKVKGDYLYFAFSRVLEITNPVTKHDEIRAVIRIFKLMSSMSKLKAIVVPNKGDMKAVNQLPKIRLCFRFIV